MKLRLSINILELKKNWLVSCSFFFIEKWILSFCLKKDSIDKYEIENNTIIKIKSILKVFSKALPEDVQTILKIH